uniref:Uncharacterized protein n=1 Tax=Tetranychus urticae TaxID=32264 RepID=T1L0S0_TETUR
MDRGSQTNQRNPTHSPNGPGQNERYAGTGPFKPNEPVQPNTHLKFSRPQCCDLGNQANRMNPNNAAFSNSRAGNKK